MSYRLFETDSHVRHYAEARPDPPIALINRIIEFLSEKVEENCFKLAVDLGCGSGQCTFLLSDFFEQVLGTDISPAQIREANILAASRGKKNVKFQVSPGEVIPLPPNSVQLITICTAAHWMDLEKVYAEGRRVLVPGGVLALLSGGKPVWSYNANPQKAVAFEEIISETENRLWKYVEGAASTAIQQQYQNISIPYDDLTRGFDYAVERDVSLNTICSHIRSWSFFHKFAKVEGQEAAESLLSTLKEKVKAVASSNTPEGLFSDDKRIFSEKTNYFFVMARL